MTRNNWIAFAVLASATAIGACSPKGGKLASPIVLSTSRIRLRISPTTIAITLRAIPRTASLVYRPCRNAPRSHDQ